MMAGISRSPLLRRCVYAGAAALSVGCAVECPPGSALKDDGLCHLTDTDTPPQMSDALAVDVEPVMDTLSGWGPLPPFPPSPSNRVADNPRAARLGQALFYDTRFSRTGALSCASCHDPDLHFTDGRRVAMGEELYPRNTASLVNVAAYEWVLWDGGCDTLWCQARGPFENRHEMNANRLTLGHVLFEDAELRAAYEDVFGPLPNLADTSRFPLRARPDNLAPDGELNLAWEGMTEADQFLASEILANASKALEAYQRTLRSDTSPLDTFLEGLAEEDPDKVAALSPEAQRGLLLFVGKAGCVECHDGPWLHASDFANVGLDTRQWLYYEDNGRFEAIEDLLSNEFGGASAFSDDLEWGLARLDGLEQTPDLYSAFRVPSLRNVANTGPYMHGGHFESLAEVVHHYNVLEERPFEGQTDPRLQPLGLSKSEEAELVAFLESLAMDPVAAEIRQPLTTAP